MITQDEDGSFTVRSGDINIFLGIVEEQSKVYTENLEKENLDKSNLGNIIRINNNQIFPPYICTLFSALYLEAFIYDYCARKDSTSLAKTLDKLDPPNKWLIGTKLINGTGIDSSKKSYQDLKNLFSLRNKLAHSKTKQIDMENSDNNIRNKNFLEPIEYLNIIKEILKELLLTDENDIYTKLIIHRLEGNITV